MGTNRDSILTRTRQLFLSEQILCPSKMNRLFLLLAVCIAATAAKKINGVTKASDDISTLLLDYPDARLPHIGVCEREAAGCARPILDFSRTLLGAFNGRIPFSTSVDRVNAWCRGVQEVLPCLRHGTCAGTPPREKVLGNLNRLCSQTGRAKLLALDGKRCDLTLDENVIITDCLRRRGMLIGMDSHINGQVKCEYLSAMKDCQLLAKRRRCGEAVKAFYEFAMYPPTVIIDCV